MDEVMREKVATGAWDSMAILYYIILCSLLLQSKYIILLMHE